MCGSVVGVVGGCCTMHEGEVLAGGNRCEVGVQFLPLLKKKRKKQCLQRDHKFFNVQLRWVLAK